MDLQNASVLNIFRNLRDWFVVDIFLEEWDGQRKRKRQVDLLVLEGSCDEVGLGELLQSESRSCFRMLDDESAKDESDEKGDEYLSIHDYCGESKRVNQ